MAAILLPLPDSSTTIRVRATCTLFRRLLSDLKGLLFGLGLEALSLRLLFVNQAASKPSHPADATWSSTDAITNGLYIIRSGWFHNCGGNDDVVVVVVVVVVVISPWLMDLPRGSYFQFFLLYLNILL